MNKRNFETNSQKVTVSFKEFKLGNMEDGKIGYYIEGEEIRNYLNIKKGAFYKILKGIKKHNGQAYVIEYNNKYYVSQFGFELFLIRFRGNKNIASDLILGKYRNKNKNSKKEVFRPKEKGIKGIESSNVIFRIKDEKVYIHTKSIAKLNNINERDLTEKCEREYFFNKKDYKPFSISKRNIITSYLISEEAYDKLVNIENKKIKEIYRKVF